jgi:hypothetical protein
MTGSAIRAVRPSPEPTFILLRALWLLPVSRAALIGRIFVHGGID